ncbi:MAG: sulfurtransferase [Gammaproteobacteria bacterium]|jgi:rhodanese-related sulfurtransferase|nr:sulfurtransferase [Gammaproteobacteria bacterium]
MQQITVKDLKHLLDNGQSEPLLLDVREPWEFDICRIEGSRLIPMRQIHTIVEQLNHDQHTIVICHHGVRSRQVCSYLMQMGFNNVVNLIGGVQAWAHEVDPRMPTY